MTAGTKEELAQKLQDCDVRAQVLETALRQIAEEPTIQPAALQKIAETALQKAGERSTT